MVTIIIFIVLQTTLTSSVRINTPKLWLISPRYGGGVEFFSQMIPVTELVLIKSEDLEDEVVRNNVLFPKAASFNKIKKASILL